MFVKPKYTRDSTKMNLDRVYTDEGANTGKVACNTYNIERYNSIGNFELSDQLAAKLKNYTYDPFKQYESNKHWILKARKNYEAKVKNDGGNESIN